MKRVAALSALVLSVAAFAVVSACAEAPAELIVPVQDNSPTESQETKIPAPPAPVTIPSEAGPKDAAAEATAKKEEEPEEPEEPEAEVCDPNGPSYMMQTLYITTMMLAGTPPTTCPCSAGECCVSSAGMDLGCAPSMP